MLQARRIRRLAPKLQANDDSNVTVTSGTIMSMPPTPVTGENRTKKELDDDSSGSDGEGLMHAVEVTGHDSETEVRDVLILDF